MPDPAMRSCTRAVAFVAMVILGVVAGVVLESVELAGLLLARVVSGTRHR